MTSPPALDAIIDYSLPYPNVRSVPLFALPQQPPDAVLDVIAELHRVGRAARYLADYASHTLEMIPARHHRVICEAIDDLLNDEYDELIVNTPPGSAKSSYTSHALGAYFLGRFPHKNIILATHTAELSERWSGKVRNTLTTQEHQRVFPDSQLSKDTTARSRWATSMGGEFLAAGVGASILGFRADLALIDDPIGGFEQAQSETQLKKVQDWFETDLLTRLKPRAKLVLICQRLSPNDLAGYLIERNAMNPTRRQRVLTLRMEAEDGDPDDGTHRKPGDRLWPEWFTQQMVEDARRDPYRWQTLYQQRPPSAKGDWVPPQHLHILDADDPVYTTAALHYYLCIDLALSINKGDYTVILTVGIDARGMIHVVDAWRERVAIEVTTDRLIDFVAARRPMECLIDDDNAAKVFLQLVASRARERGTAVPMKMMKMMGQDKETRAAPLRGLFRSDRVFLKRAPWNEWLVRELLIFPNAMGAGVDDGVDALGLIGRRLVQLARPALPAIYTPPPTLRQMCLEDLYDDRDRAKGAFSRKRF